MTVDGTSEYQNLTGNDTDTYTQIVDNEDTAVENHVSGALEAITQMQTVMGGGADLNGSLTSLVDRLAVRIKADGTLEVVPADEGGTGQSVYTIGDLIYASATTTLSKLNIGTAGQVLSTDGTNPVWGSSMGIRGPGSIASGSTMSHSSTESNWSGTQTGLHAFTAVTIPNGNTVTCGGRWIVIWARDSITIGGTLTASGTGIAGGTGGTGAGAAGNAGTSQPGGGGGISSSPPDNAGGVGGGVIWNGFTIVSGGAGGTAGTAQTTGTALLGQVGDWWGFGGGSGGAGGGDGANTAGSGGAGGGSIVLIAPTITLDATAILNTSGANGTNGAGNDTGGGGGGGAGNIIMHCQSYTDNGATFTQTGGTGGNGGVNAQDGGDGAAGYKQIFIYN